MSAELIIKEINQLKTQLQQAHTGDNQDAKVFNEYVKKLVNLKQHVRKALLGLPCYDFELPECRIVHLGNGRMHFRLKIRELKLCTDVACHYKIVIRIRNNSFAFEEQFQLKKFQDIRLESEIVSAFEGLFEEFPLKLSVMLHADFGLGTYERQEPCFITLYSTELDILHFLHDCSEIEEYVSFSTQTSTSDIMQQLKYPSEKKYKEEPKLIIASKDGLKACALAYRTLLALLLGDLVEDAILKKCIKSAHRATFMILNKEVMINLHKEEKIDHVLVTVDVSCVNEILKAHVINAIHRRLCNLTDTRAFTGYASQITGKIATIKEDETFRTKYKDLFKNSPNAYFLNAENLGLPSSVDLTISNSTSGSQAILPQNESRSNKTSPMIILNVNNGGNGSSSGNNKSTDRWYYGDYDDGYNSYYDSDIPIWGTKISSSFIGFYGIMLLCHLSISALWLVDMIKFRKVHIPFRYFLTGVFLLRTVAQLTKLLLSIQNQDISQNEQSNTLLQLLLLPSVYFDQGAIVALTLFVSRGWGIVKRLPNTLEIVSFTMWALAVCLISSSSYMYGGYRTRHNPFYLLIFAYLLLLVYKYMDALKQFFAVCPAKFTQWHVKPVELNADGSTQPVETTEVPFEGKLQFVDKLQKIFTVYLTVRVLSELLVQSQLSLNFSIYFYEFRELVFTAALLQVFLLSTKQNIWSRVYMLVPENSEAATTPQQQPYTESTRNIAVIPTNTNIQSLRQRLQNLQRMAELSQYIQRNEEPLEASKYRFLQVPTTITRNNDEKAFEYKLLRFKQQ